MAPVDLRNIIKDHKNKWVALTPNNKKLVASANSLKKVLLIANERGVKDPSVFKVPQSIGYFSG